MTIYFVEEMLQTSDLFQRANSGTITENSTRKIILDFVRMEKFKKYSRKMSGELYTWLMPLFQPVKKKEVIALINYLILCPLTTILLTNKTGLEKALEELFQDLTICFL